MAFQVRRGTNISHWLSQSKRRGEDRRKWFTRDDVKRIASWGMDHIRLPIDEVQMWAEGDLGKQRRESEGFDLMESALDWCAAENLRVIVDLHILRSHSFMDKNPRLYTDEREAQRFAWLWEDLSAALKSRSTEKVAYEFMNEAVAQDDADWNRVYQYPYRVLRKLEPARTLVLGSNKWNQCQTFAALEVPANDPAMILTFHFYNPMLVTHYRAPWVPNIAQYTGPNQYPGKQIPDEEWAKLSEKVRGDLATENRFFDAAAMEHDMSLPISIAKRFGYPLYCGEFGVVKYTPDPVRIRWYRDILSVFSRHNIGWGNWDYKGDFGLLDGEGRKTGVYTGLLG